MSRKEGGNSPNQQARNLCRYLMNDLRTWRQLLGKIICNPLERQRVADLIGVKPITLTRWSIHKSTPKLDALRSLLRALPHHQTEMRSLLAADFPALASELQESDSLIFEVPSAFYGRVLSTCTTCPPLLRKTTICTLLLQQMLAHLDPHHQGMTLLLLLCVPPRDGRKVRSLYTAFACAHPSWENYLEQRGGFFGAESQPGYALHAGHPIVTHYQDEQNWLYPTYLFDFAECIVSSPLLLGDQTAGCLSLTCTQKYTFTQAHLDLIQAYTDLLTVAFEISDFYSFPEIELELMPPHALQQPYLAQFRQRVTQHTIQSAQQQLPLTRAQAELSVWQTLEEDLLYLALHPQPSSKPG
ncbi:MAG TPA: GAF domain-containing protein [Ktedonobacteraceae bacterium]|jgi:hypothetical protein|nr:GAF domain-containing protein [Ktedonobacteraceae bacterium]